MGIEEEAKLLDTRMRLRFINGIRLELSVRVNYEAEPEQATALYGLFMKYVGRRPSLGDNQAVFLRVSAEDTVLDMLETHLTRLDERRKLAELGIEFLRSTDAQHMAALVIAISAEDTRVANIRKPIGVVVPTPGKYGTPDWG